MQTTKIIWINGCFDVLHRGHIELFKFAKSQGDFLVVGVDADERIKKAKGSSRPFNNLKDRVCMLNAIKYIDEVVSFSSDEGLEQYINLYRPEIIVIGSDWKGKKIIGQRFAKEVKYFNRIGDYSTSKILEEK